MAVRGGARQAVREVPFAAFEEHPSALLVSGVEDCSCFRWIPLNTDPESYTPHQFLYLAHDDIRLMGRPLGPGQSPGRLRIRRQKDELSIASLFQWEYPTQAGWVPLPQVEERDEQLGMIEQSLQTTMPDVMPIPFSMESSRVQLPEAIADAQWWIRGRLDFERWLANRMLDDLEVTWKDDRGGEDRKINNWDVRSSGRTIESFLQDLPPIKGGWTLRMQLVDRGLLLVGIAISQRIVGISVEERLGKRLHRSEYGKRAPRPLLLVRSRIWPAMGTTFGPKESKPCL